MSERSASLIDITAPNRLQITKWKVKKGSKVAQGAVLGFYQIINNDDCKKTDKIPPEQETGTQLSSPNSQLHKLKATHVGTVSEIIADEGQEISEGSIILQIKGCSHPTVMKDMCADCGADLRTEMGLSGCRKETVSATVPMVHSIPELIVSEEQALELGQADEIRLKKTRKLVLLVDLDQTLIHTTNDNIPPNLKGIHHFKLWQGMNLLWYHTRIRPHTQQFLENISKLYELHICTFGVRMYAHTIARFIDPARKFFSHRILSRDECFNAMSKTANLKALFPCGDSMVCIIDDREDVWNFAPNLIHVKPYRFFQGTADINAPPGLSKKENDSKPITHHVRKVSTSSTGSSSSEKGKGASTGSKDKDKTSKNVAKEKKDSEESGPQKSKVEENVTTVDPIPKEEISDAAPKDDEEEGEKNVDMVKMKDDADNSTSQKEEKDTKTLPEDLPKEENSDTVESKEENTDTVESKETSESKSDGDAGSKDEDMEGLSEDSSMSGMSTNANSKNDDSNAESNEDDDDNGNEDKMIEWEDEDDYLFYLEEILQRIHTAYFKISDQLSAEGKSSEVNLDLKSIIPYVKRKVLKGCNICFSGVIPLNTPVSKIRAYNVALSLGAKVHDTFVPYSTSKKSNYTTHLIANKMGTSKVNAAKRARKVSIISLDWLWSCAERWEHVDEKLFLLKEKDSLDSDNDLSSPELTKRSKSSKRKANQDIDGDDDVFSLESKMQKMEDDSESSDVDDDEDQSLENDGKGGDDNNNSGGRNPKKVKRSGSHYNPLYSFSDEERATMDKELEELMDEDDSDSDEKEAEAQLRKQVLRERKCDTSSEDSLSGEFPHGWNSKKWSKCRSGKKKVSIKRDESIDSEDSEASISEKYEKSIEIFAAHESDSSNDDSECESIGSIDEEIAEAVEKEFLAR